MERARRRDVPARTACIHELFEAQAARTPDAVAVVFEEQALTLRASWTRAPTGSRTTCAALGVGPEVRVGVCLERALELVVGLLGVLKAGGAYVPLDPAIPPERLALHAGGRRRRRCC